jgi:NAD(P)H dehydrogenase (quinone)
MILVYLASGVRGGAVARVALEAGLRVRALVRDERAAAPLAALGAEVAAGRLDDPEFLERAHRGISRVVLQLPLGAPLSLAKRAVDAAGSAAIDGLVLRLASASRPAPCTEPSFVANAAIEELVRGSGLPHAVIRPTMYLENLLKPGLRDEIAHGTLEMPVATEQRIAWTNVEDCARAAIALLHACDGGDHLVAGPEALCGTDLAAALSAGLGCEVRFRSQSVEAFEEEVAAAMGQALASGIAAKFRYFRDHRADADSILAPAVSRGMRGLAPETVGAWVARHRHAFRPPS